MQPKYIVGLTIAALVLSLAAYVPAGAADAALPDR